MQVLYISRERAGVYILTILYQSRNLPKNEEKNKPYSIVLFSKNSYQQNGSKNRVIFQSSHLA